jgi:hypothetical protein
MHPRTPNIGVLMVPCEGEGEGEGGGEGARVRVGVARIAYPGVSGGSSRRVASGAQCGA